MVKIDMRMPSACCECPLEAATFRPQFHTICPYLEQVTAPMRIEGRLADCPLQEEADDA